jgi:hypothetical protein
MVAPFTDLQDGDAENLIYVVFALLSGVTVEYSFTFIYLEFPAIVGTNSTFRGYSFVV